MYPPFLGKIAVCVSVYKFMKQAIPKTVTNSF